MNNIDIKELNISTEMEEFTKENGYSFANIKWKCDEEPGFDCYSSEQEEQATFSMTFDTIKEDGSVIESYNFDVEDFEWTIYMDDEGNVNQQLFQLEREISNLYQNNNVQKMPKFLADKISEVMVQESI